MSLYRLGLLPASKVVLVALSPDTLPANVDGETVVSLDTFEHTDELGDTLSGQAYGPSHVIFHHIQEALYHRKLSNPAARAMFPDGMYDLQSYQFRAHGPLMAATSIRASGIAVTVGAAAVPLVVKALPSGTALAASSLNFASAATATATVSAAGAVTGVAAGSTTIKVSTKDGRYSIDVPVTVAAAPPAEG